MKTTFRKQRGITFGGFIMFIVVFAVVSIYAMKLIPAYMENGKVQRALDSIANDPAMQAASAREIKESFSKRANTMDNVTSVMPDDLEISKDGNKLVISVTYSKKIPLGGNVSLVVDFKPTSAK